MEFFARKNWPKIFQINLVWTPAPSVIWILGIMLPHVWNRPQVASNLFIELFMILAPQNFKFLPFLEWIVCDIRSWRFHDIYSSVIVKDRRLKNLWNFLTYTKFRWIASIKYLKNSSIFSPNSHKFSRKKFFKMNLDQDIKNPQ